MTFGAVCELPHSHIDANLVYSTIRATSVQQQKQKLQQSSRFFLTNTSKTLTNTETKLCCLKKFNKEDPIVENLSLKHFKANLVHLYILNTVLETPELPHFRNSKEELLVLKNQFTPNTTKL